MSNDKHLQGAQVQLNSLSLTSSVVPGNGSYSMQRTTPVLMKRCGDVAGFASLAED